MQDQKDLLLMELLVKVAAIHKILVKKNLLNDQEILDQMTLISEDLVAQMKAAIPESKDTSTNN